ncbi:hypothetical protein TSMEX_002869 [Taenia solium]|eukprot:TsM_001153400 transcript=TsM_001153400 gene=TsM_001153400
MGFVKLTSFKSDSYVRDKGLVFTFTESRPNPPSPEPQQQHQQGINQFSFHYLRDMPDLIELSQKLQARLADAFRSSLTNQSPENGSRQEIGGQLRAYLSREAAIRLSQRLLANQGVSVVHQKPARSRTRRTLDYERELTSGSWNGQQRGQRVSSSNQELWDPGVAHHSSIRRRLSRPNTYELELVPPCQLLGRLSGVRPNELRAVVKQRAGRRNVRAQFSPKKNCNPKPVFFIPCGCDLS